MRRIPSTPRPGWQQRVEEAGLVWNSSEQRCWNESAFYQFTAQEVASLESVTNELEAMTIRAAGQSVSGGRAHAMDGAAVEDAALE